MVHQYIWNLNSRYIVIYCFVTILLNFDNIYWYKPTESRQKYSSCNNYITVSITMYIIVFMFSYNTSKLKTYVFYWNTVFMIDVRVSKVKTEDIDLITLSRSVILWLFTGLYIKETWNWLILYSVDEKRINLLATCVVFTICVPQFVQYFWYRKFL